MRLIDADALIQLLCVNMDTGQQFYLATHCVDVMPTVDAVLAIRCKDCAYWTDADTEHLAGYCHYREAEEITFSFEYCAWAERKEE